MLFALKRLSLGLTLIVAASVLLLGMDMNRRAGSAGHLPQIAILQHASIGSLDDGVRGMIAGLEAKGFRAGERAVITKYNAEGDAATASAIAREITDGRYKLVLTSSTLSLQAVANANKDGRTIHVFGIVADPYVAGVGLDRDHPLAHPRRLVGYGVLLPVDDVFRLAHRMYPALKRVGVAWNPAEANSRRFTTMARQVCQELGIELLEAQVDSPSGIVEAINSLISRDAQALWIGGDVTVSGATPTVLKLAERAKIPVFSILPGDPRRGSLFDLGLDFFEAGQTGELAAEILNGKDPATIPIRDIVQEIPRQLTINECVLTGLRDPWRIPPDVARSANVLVDGCRDRNSAHPFQDPGAPGRDSGNDRALLNQLAYPWPQQCAVSGRNHARHIRRATGREPPGRRNQR
jgi:putative ABC transport system substrate-binding protein